MSDTLEVWTSHRDVSDVVKELAPFVDETSLRLAAGRRIPDGDWVRFSVHLLDGSKVLEGIGRCQESTQEGASTYRVRLSLLSFDERNEIMWERMLLARDDGAVSTGNFDVRSLRDKILKPPPSAPSKSAPPPPPARPRPGSGLPPPPPKPSTRPPPPGALPRPAAIPRPSSLPPPRPSSFPAPVRPMSDSPRPAPLPKLEARPRTSPPTPSAKPPGEAETRPRPPKLPLAAPKPTSLPPVDPGLVDDGWSDRPPPVSRPAPVQKPEPAPKPSPKPALEKPREAPRAPAPVAKPPEPEPPPLDDLEPSPTQVAAAPPRPEPSPLLDSDATSTEIAAPGPPSDAALAATAERTSPATPIPDSSTHDAPFSPQLTEETHHGLRLSIPARLVERARALAPNLPAGVLRITPVRETPEEAVLRAALGLGLASLAALADADDEDA